MKHASVEVRRTTRAVYMACDGCGNEWVIFLTPAGYRKAGYGFTRTCPSVQQQRRSDASTH